MTDDEIREKFGPMTFAKLPRCAAVNDKHAAQDRAITAILGEPEQAGAALAKAGVSMQGMLDLIAEQSREWRLLAIHLEAELAIVKQGQSTGTSEKDELTAIFGKDKMP